MASQKQVEANKRNAKRSTGPKTETGKAVSRQNAYKHGLTAQTIVVGDEDPSQFEELRAELVQEFKPRPGIEFALVDRLATYIWRMRRIPIFEAALINVTRAENDKNNPWIADELMRRENMSKIAERFRLASEQLFKDHRPPKLVSDELTNSGRVDPAREEEEEKVEELEEPKVAISGAVLLELLQSQDVLGKLARYEAALANGFKRTIQELLFMQNRRQLPTIVPSPSNNQDAA